MELFKKQGNDKGYQYFIEDGLFCEEEWNKQSIRIPFALKTG